MTELNQTQQKQLLQLARQTIVSGLTQHRSLIPPANHDLVLNQQAACFVTLTRQHQLRGCIGSLRPYRPLLLDVSANAYAAAFADPRFPPLRIDELDDLKIEISVLGPLIPMTVTSEQDLLNQLQPDIDGLVIEEGVRRATFLPLVWVQLADKRQFLTHLKAKAGFAADYWSDQIRCYRYRTQVFQE